MWSWLVSAEFAATATGVVVALTLAVFTHGPDERGAFAVVMLAGVA